MTQHYESAATVVIDGEVIPVQAQFTVDTDGPLKTWYGELSANEPGLAFKLLAGQRSLLRMPDGQEAPILPGGHNSTEGIAFQGSGPAPV